MSTFTTLYSKSPLFFLGDDTRTWATFINGPLFLSFLPGIEWIKYSEKKSIVQFVLTHGRYIILSFSGKRWIIPSRTTTQWGGFSYISSTSTSAAKQHTGDGRAPSSVINFLLHLRLTLRRKGLKNIPPPFSTFISITYSTSSIALPVGGGGPTKIPYGKNAAEAEEKTVVVVLLLLRRRRRDIVLQKFLFHFQD